MTSIHRTPPVQKTLFLDCVFISLTLLFASLGRSYRSDGLQYPGFNVPIDLAISNGRYIATGLLLLWFLIRFREIRFRMPTGVTLPLFLLQLFFLVKTSVAGNNEVAILGTISLCLQIWLLHSYVWSREWQVLASRSAAGFDHSVVPLSIAAFATLFAAVNFSAYIFYPGSAATEFGRFFGTMSNPQHFMMCAVLAIPAVIHTARRTKNVLIAGTLILTLTLLIYLVYQTGSRSGLLALGLALLISNRDLFRPPLGFILPLALLSIIILMGAELSSAVSADFFARFLENREDTRSAIWATKIQEFLDYPVFGAPTTEGGRVAFSETLWLSIAAQGGIFGLILGALILFRLVHLIARLSRQNRRPTANFYASALAAILALSIFESIFLGLFTTMAMLSIAYFSGADAYVRRLELASAKNASLSHRPASTQTTRVG